MAASKEDIKISGRYGTYLLRKPIGSGGNGIVYNVEIENKVADIPSANSYVLKRLTFYNGMNRKDKKEREERFRREVETVSTKLGDKTGIVPIFDSSYENNGHPFQWYLMPKAERFTYNKNTLEDNLHYMMQVAEAISSLHKMGLAHRDIKPSNALIYNDRLCLSDFGLIWSNEFDLQLTEENESIGPIAIRPPELEAPVNCDGDAFLKSDVYLFAKTLWIVLTGIKKGFYNQYSRADDNIYLKSIIQTKYCLEPLHLLMKKSTFDDYEKRITIDECCDLLSDQIDILHGNVPDGELRKFKFDEAIKRVRQNAQPDEIIITNENEIYKQLNVMAMNSKVVISEYGEDKEIGYFYSIVPIDKNVYEIKSKATLGIRNPYVKTLRFRIKDVHISSEENCCIANTERFDNPEGYGEICRDIVSLSKNKEGVLCVDGSFELIFCQY